MAWVDNWSIDPGEGEFEDPEPDPLESFDSMEEEVVSGERGATLTDPILPCKEPWLELTLLGPDDEPAAFADYRLSAPGAERSGKLDKDGHVRIDGIDVAADEVMLKIQIVDDEDPEKPPTYELQLTPIEKDDVLKQQAIEKIPDEPEYFQPTFDGRVFVEAEDDREETGDD
jgi:hypothetical protein